MLRGILVSSPYITLFVVFTQTQTCVSTTKPKAVGQTRIHSHVLWFVGNVVAVKLSCGLLEIQRWRQHVLQKSASLLLSKVK